MNRPLRRLRRTGDTAFNLLRQGSVVKKSPSQLQPSHRVTLSEAKGLSRSAESSFASLRMTGLTLSVGEELSRSFEPCLNKGRVTSCSHLPNFLRSQGGLQTEMILQPVSVHMILNRSLPHHRCKTVMQQARM